jgi:hypothetical protein
MHLNPCAGGLRGIGLPWRGWGKAPQSGFFQRTTTFRLNQRHSS